MIISSDASLLRWEASCSGIQTEGPWSEQKSLHINCLEIQAAFLTVQTFLRDQSEVLVLLQVDNTTAVAYINSLGGIVSPQLTSLARSLWMWALQRDIMLTAHHIPGISNCVADMESRTIRDRTDWKLSPIVFNMINEVFGPLEIDPFASQLIHQLPQYFSWRPDLLARQWMPFNRTGEP